MIEYRIGWSASSNISFQGFTDWLAYDEDPAASAEEVETAMTAGNFSHLPYGMGEALEASGFDWWVETRDAKD